MKLSQIIILSFICSVIHSQRYPVQVSTMVTPPYSVYLNEYGSDAYDRLQVTVTALDMTRVNYPVKLKLIIESFDGKIQMETSPNYLPPPVYLQGGIPEVLTSYDLQGHFNLNNLVTSGIDRNELLRTGRLPEGYYRIGFEVLDYNRATIGNEVVVSNYGHMTAGLFLNDPPIINLPQDGAVLKPFEPQNIMFSWTPRHKGSPNSAFTAEYIFRIYEVWNSWQDPNITVQTQLPVYETSVMSTSLVYGPAEPALIYGKEYVFTVQARDIQGRDLFRNNGISEAFMFKYGEECLPPDDITPEAINGPGIDLHWKTADAHTDYNVEYRTAGNSSDWFTDNTLLDNHSIYELQYNTQYEVRIQSVCGTGMSEYCEPLLVTTIDGQQQQFICGGDPGIPVVTNSNPQPNLVPGSIFYAGGYECKVTKVNDRDGIFSGECLVTIPYYGYAKVRHSFENIFVNELGQMSSGKLVSLISDSDDYMVDLNPDEWGDDNTDEVQAAAMALALETDTLWQIDGIIENILYNEASGTIIVTTTDGETLEFEDKNNGKVLVSDEAGNQYFVDKGNISNAADALAAVSGSEAQQVNNIDSLAAVLPHIYFNPSKDQQFGYDSLQHDALRSMYSEVTLHDKTYIPAWKAVSTQKADYVEARLPVSSSLDINSFGFKTSSSLVPAFPAEDDTRRKLTVSTPLAGDTDYLSVYYSMQDTAGNTREEELGRLNLAAYEPLVNTVCIVPVNGVEKPVASRLQSSFKDIFGQAVAGWNVIVDENFYISQDEYDKDGDKTFEDDDNDDLMDYTREMKVLINAYKEQSETYDKNTYYIFLIDEPLKEGKLKGYMPLKHQCGFVFTGKAGEEEVLARNIAHELAHGAYRLRHTFSNKNEYYQTRYSTENLMDYTEGSRLNKYQWDLIHDPESMILTFLEEEEEGEAFFKIRWLGNYFWGLPSDRLEIEIDTKSDLFNHVFNNYNKYYNDSKLKNINIDIEEYKSWTIRKSSHQGIAKKVFTGLIDNNTTFSLYDEGIYFEEYTLEDKSYKVAVFSKIKDITLNDNIRIKSFTKLKDITSVRIGYTNDYGLITFFDNDGKMQMIFQIIGDYNTQDFIVQWVNYLGLILPTEEQKKEDNDDKIQKSVDAIKLHSKEVLTYIWNDLPIVTTSDKIINILQSFRASNLDGNSYASFKKELDLCANDITINNKTFNYISIELNFTNNDECEYIIEEMKEVCEVDLNTQLYNTGNTCIKEINGEKQKCVKFQFGDYIYAGDFEPQEDWKEFYITTLESDVEELRNFLFPNIRKEKIQIALIAMEQYLGNSYKYGGGESRTSLDEEGTKEMDCSEFMCRFLQQLGLFETVPVITSSTLRDDKTFSETKYGEKLQYIPGSNEEDFIPQPGDVFVWSKSSGDGHTGIVLEYDSEDDYVIILEAIGNGNSEGYCSCEQNSLNSLRGCGKVVKSTYTRLGNALYSHEGWIGYYRPVIE